MVRTGTAISRLGSKELAPATVLPIYNRSHAVDDLDFAKVWGIAGRGCSKGERAILTEWIGRGR